jgi:hypothetical protein
MTAFSLPSLGSNADAIGLGIIIAGLLAAKAGQTDVGLSLINEGLKAASIPIVATLQVPPTTK